MKQKLIASFFSLTMFFVASVADALPTHNYAPWRIGCSGETTQTVKHPDGSLRKVAPSEIWSSELQVDEELKESSARCWCQTQASDQQQYESDTKELGSGNGWWTFVKHLTASGQNCSCNSGQMIMMELDQETCIGSEAASGFFECSNNITSSSNNGWVWGVIGGAIGTIVAAIATTSITVTSVVLCNRYMKKSRSSDGVDYRRLKDI